VLPPHRCGVAPRFQGGEHLLGAAQGMQERRRRRLPWMTQSSQHPRQLLLRVGGGVHGSAWPPRAAARRLGGAVYSDLQLPPRLRILPLFFSFLPLLSDSWWWRRIWMGIREAGWGLGSYRWPARVWSPKGTAGILGVRACGHAAHIRVRQNGGGSGHGGRRSPCPTARVTPVTG
jgi:hypothetical protein